MSITTRFAPSPTGYLHLGHAFSAWNNFRRGGIFRLRLEDIDTTRCRPEYAAAIQEDLAWLGLHWHGEIRVQSQHLPDYQAALEKLLPFLYPCFCTRRDLAQSAPHGAEKLYPGTCRHLSETEKTGRLAAGAPYALRLDIAAALPAKKLRFYEETTGWITADPTRLGDPILARKDIPTSYHLCVVHDDAAQNITHIIRGEDLRESTHLHTLLQHLLGVPTPIYAHHKLLTNAAGQRLAKRDNAQTLRSLRHSGIAPITLLRQFESLP